MSLREKVYIKTPAGNLEGELFVGTDGLPELDVFAGDMTCLYRTYAFPAAWSITSPSHGLLLTAWTQIETIREQIRDAQREAEAEDEDRDHAKQRDIDNRIAQEIDERRAEL